MQIANQNHPWKIPYWWNHPNSVKRSNQSGYKSTKKKRERTPERYLMWYPVTTKVREGYKFMTFTLPRDVYDHKEYPLCLSCDKKFVPIDKGDEWCFKCKMTK